MNRQFGVEDQRAIAEANRKKQAALDAMRRRTPVQRPVQSLRAFGVEDQRAIQRARAQNTTRPLGGSADAMERQAVAQKYGVSENEAARIITNQTNASRAKQGLQPVGQKTGGGGKPDKKKKNEKKKTGGKQTGTATTGAIEEYRPGGVVTPEVQPVAQPTMQRPTQAAPSFSMPSAQQSALTEMQGTAAGGETGRMRISPSSTGRSEAKLTSPMINRPQAPRESTSLLSRSERAYDPTAAYRNLRY